MSESALSTFGISHRISGGIGAVLFEKSNDRLGSRKSFLSALAGAFACREINAHEPAGTTASISPPPD